MNKIIHELYTFEDKTNDEVLLMNGFQHINQLIPYINELQKENKKWESLKEKVNEGIRVYRNRGYDLVFDIDEVPKEEINGFITYLAMETMEALINQIQESGDSDE